MMMPVSAQATPQNIWTKDAFEHWIAAMLNEEREARVRFSISPMSDDEAIELTHAIVRNVTAEVPPAGNG